MDESALAELLARPTLQERLAHLGDTGRLDRQGVAELLDAAAALIHRDPLAARELAAICTAADARGVWGDVRPRSQYVQAQSHAIDGDFVTALRLIEAARTAWDSIGATTQALRTELGRMHVLNELGRHDQAIRAGEGVLQALVEAPDDPARRLLRARTLQNLGICLAFTGRYDDALEAYDEAAAQLLALGAARELGEVAHNRAEALRDVGRISEAVVAFEEAAAAFSAGESTLLEARCLAEAGGARLLLGHYVEALGAFQEARGAFQALGVQADLALVDLGTADAYASLNLHEEAVILYRRVEAVLREAGMAFYLGRALVGRGMSLVDMGASGEAEGALAEAVQVHEAAGHVPAVAGALLGIASARARRGERAGALEAATTALERLLAGDWPVPTFHAHLAMGDLLLPAVERAEPHVQAARLLAARLALPPLSHLSAQRLGRLRRLQGRDGEALPLLEEAVETIEALRRTLPQEAMRTAFLTDKTDAFSDLLGLWLDRGDPASIRHAFDVAERAKARALLDLLSGLARARRAGATGGTPGEAELRRLEDDLSAAYSALLVEGEGGRHPDRSARIREHVVELEHRGRLLRLEHPRVDGRSSAVGEPVPLVELRQQLPEELVLVAYHILADGEVVAFVSRGPALHAVREVTSASRVASLVDGLAAQWRRFAVGGGFGERHAALLAATTARLLQELHDELVAPLAPQLGGVAAHGVGRLVVIPHGVLHQVPFHALLDGERHLLERFELSIAPSAAVLGACGTHRGRPRRPARALVLGHGGHGIPHAEAEARAVAARFPGADLRLGAAATVASVLEGAAGRDIIHIATHGLFRPENPLFSALRLHDGWLTAGQVLDGGLDVDGAIVALSACESGRSRVLGGEESLGLARAFLAAGAATVLVSLWLVRDDTAAVLMDRWYALLAAGARPAAALRTAQLELAEEHPHPYHWAPFVLVGAA